MQARPGLPGVYGMTITQNLKSSRLTIAFKFGTMMKTCPASEFIKQFIQYTATDDK